MADIKLNEEVLTDIVIVANTPTFLYERFRRDSSVQGLAERFSAQDLVARAYSFQADPETRFQDKVKAYAHIVALSFKSASDVRLSLEGATLPSYEWISELLTLALTDSTSMVTMDTTFVRKPAEYIGPKTSTSTNIEAIIVPNRIKSVSGIPDDSSSNRKECNF